jgi:hypothetical protein
MPLVGSYQHRALSIPMPWLASSTVAEGKC